MMAGKQVVPIFDVGFVLADLGVTVHLDAKVIARLLPIHFTVGNAKQVLNPNFVSAGYLQQGDTGRCILLLTHPIGNRVVCGAPGEIPNTLNLQREKILFFRHHFKFVLVLNTLIDFFSSSPKEGVS